MDSNSTKTWWAEYGLIASAMLWLLAWLIARAGLEQTVWATRARVALALLPVLPFAFFLWTFVNGVRSMDELERRIHLEALALAYPLVMLLLMILGLMELAVDLNPDDWSYRHVWAFLPLFYFMGLALARRRYS